MKQKISKLKIKLRTPKDKIEFVIFILQYVLLIFAILALLANIILLLLPFTDVLTKTDNSSTINILLSMIIIVAFFTFDKFKKIREKFLDKKDVKKDNKKDNKGKKEKKEGKKK